MRSRAYLLNWFLAVVAAVLVISGALYTESTFVEQMRKNRILEARSAVSEVAAKIEREVHWNITGMQKLAAQLSVSTGPDQQAFDRAVATYLQESRITEQMFRVSGEYQYTHHYPLTEPDDRVGAFIAVDTPAYQAAVSALSAGPRAIQVAHGAAPHDLQIWLPVAETARHDRTALLLFSLSAKTLYEITGLDRLSREYTLALRALKQGRPADVFYGPSDLFSEADFVHALPMNGFHWQIGVRLAEQSFAERSSRLWIQMTAVLLVALIGFILWLRLKELRTVQLNEKQQFMLDQAQRVGRIGNWSWDLQRDEVFWSDEAYRLFGLEQGDPVLQRQGYLAFVHKEDRPDVEAAVNDAMNRGGRYVADFRLLRADFDLRWVHSEGFVELSADRRPIRVFGIFQDVTASRKVERELKQREAQLTAITDAAQSLIMITRVTDGLIRFCNPSSERMLGLPPETMMGRFITDFYPSPDDRQRLLDKVAREQQLSNETLRLRRADTGELVTFLIGLQQISFAGEDCFVVDMVDISSMLAAQAALADSEEKFRLFAENIPGIFWLYEPESRCIEFISHGYEQITGAASADVLSGRRSLFDTVVPEDEPLVRQIFDVTALPAKFEFRLRRQDDEIIWLRSLSFATYSRDGRVKNIAGFSEDITEAYLSHQRIKLAASVFESTAEAIVVTDTKNRIVSVNEAFTRITGYQPDEVLGENPSILSSGQQSEDFYQAMWRSLMATGSWQGEVWNRKKNGELYVEWLSITALKNRYQEVENYVAVFSDITDRKEKEELILYQANYDALTGLPNRVLFNDRLAQALSAAKRYNGKTGALMFIDLDHFKEVNDTQGHEAGDELLKQVAKRLLRYTRESDTVARLGGDEFTVMLPAVDDVRDVGKVAEKIIDALSRQFTLNGRSAHISASIGITIFPDDGDELTRILQNADQAMYAAKSAGRHTYRFFTPFMQQEAERRQLLQHDMRSALEQHQFELHYQPIVDQLGYPVKLEALVRWNHPEHGRIPPDKFIPLAEETGLIIPLGSWVFNQAVAQIAQLRKNYPQLQVAINLSSKQIATDELHVEHFIDIVQQFDLPPESITLEVTESLFLDPGGDSVSKLNQLRQQGFEIAIDDFGTGYSSLSYLKQLPLTTIKIDKSFVSDLDKDQGDKVLVDAILSIARSMRLDVIAEGVETRQQSDYLVAGGAQMQQGWLHGRPMPYDSLVEWLQEKM